MFFSLRYLCVFVHVCVWTISVFFLWWEPIRSTVWTTFKCSMQYSIIIYTIVYIVPPGLITRSLYFWPSLPSCPPSAHATDNHQSVLCIFVLKFDRWDHIVFVFVWFKSFSIMPSRSIHIITNGKIWFFLMLLLLLSCFSRVQLCVTP